MKLRATSKSAAGGSADALALIRRTSRAKAKKVAGQKRSTKVNSSFTDNPAQFQGAASPAKTRAKTSPGTFAGQPLQATPSTIRKEKGERPFGTQEVLAAAAAANDLRSA